MRLRSTALLPLFFFPFSGASNAGSLCSPKDNNARILSAPAPNAIDPQWSGDGFIGTGWSFYVNETVQSATGLFAKGNLHGSRGGIAQKDVFILLSEWTCAESGPEETEGIERGDTYEDVDENTAAPDSQLAVSLPQTFIVFTEKGRRVRLRVTNFGRIVADSKRFRGVSSRDSEGSGVRDYKMAYHVFPTDRLPKEDGAIIGYEIQLPRIARGDRLIINRRASRPFEVSEGGTGYQDIDAPTVFDSSYSGATRTLFTEFRGPQTMENLGEWREDLVVNGNVLVSRRFTLFDPSGRVNPNKGLVDVPEGAGPLVDLAGIWAHSADDCKVAASGELDKVSRVESTRYQLIGICGAGIEYLYDAFDCQANGVKKSGDTLDVDSSCTLKDYDPQKTHIRIKVRDSEALQFVDGKYTFDGSYVRCGHTYACVNR